MAAEDLKNLRWGIVSFDDGRRQPFVRVPIDMWTNTAQKPGSVRTALAALTRAKSRQYIKVDSPDVEDGRVTATINMAQFGYDSAATRPRMAGYVADLVTGLTRAAGAANRQDPMFKALMSNNYRVGLGGYGVRGTIGWAEDFGDDRLTEIARSTLLGSLHDVINDKSEEATLAVDVRISREAGVRMLIHSTAPEALATASLETTDRFKSPTGNPAIKTYELEPRNIMKATWAMAYLTAMVAGAHPEDVADRLRPQNSYIGHPDTIG